MKILFHHWLLVLLLGLAALQPARATHIKGGEITYASIAPTTAGVPRYHVLVTLYCDPANETLQKDVTLNATKNGCNGTGSFQVIIPRTGNSISASSTGNCPTGRLYHLYTFETDLDLPTGQWTLSATLENRQNFITNINQGASISVNMFLATYLDNTLTSQDSSPRFESQVLPILDASGVAPASFAAFDTDADSLAYSLMLPQQGTYIPGVPNGCGTPAPATTYAPQYQLNQATGALLPTAGPQPQGYYNVTARVSEYRRIGGQWRLLGYVSRDLLYLTLAPGTPANHAPAFTALTVNGTAQLLTQPVLARPGQLLRLGLSAADPDAGQQLLFVSSAPQVVPGLSLTTPAAGQAQLLWQVPATLPPGRYSLALDVFDDACPSNFNTAFTFTVVVTNNQPLATRTSLNDAHEVYPVPFREQVRFRAAPDQAVTLVDALGRTMAQLQAGPDGQVLWQPGETLRPGLYLARDASGQPLARLLRE